jgi:hypothetical protein
MFPATSEEVVSIAIAFVASTTISDDVVATGRDRSICATWPTSKRNVFRAVAKPLELTVTVYSAAVRLGKR